MATKAPVDPYAEKDKDRAYTDRKETEKRARQAPVNVGRGSLSVFRKG